MSESILIVDDELALLKLLDRLLSGLGYPVIAVQSAERALEVVQQASVGMVITDLKMQGMNGLRLAQKLLEQDADRPVLLLTAFGDLGSARQAVRIGVYEYLTKPFDAGDIIAAVRRAMERRNLLLERRTYQEGLEKKVEERTRQLQKKIQELEARDELLRSLVSVHPAQEILELAIRLALRLCGCQSGALYAPDGRNTLALQAAVGFCEEKTLTDEDGPLPLGRELYQEMRPVFDQALSKKSVTCVEHCGGIRQQLGIQSIGVAPVYTNEKMIALLEVGRRGVHAPITETDLASLRGFLPYVAMAVVDCALQQELPQWYQNAEAALAVIEKWTD